MHPVRLSRGLALLVLLACAPFTRATTVVQPTFERMVGSADYVVRVKVKAVESAWRENAAQPGQRYIASRVTLTVLETITGTPPSPLVLDLVGGKVGEDELTIDGVPTFTPGQESILFVRGNGRTFFPLVGVMHGYFPIRRDVRSGSAQVLRYDGRLLYGETDLDPAAAGVSAVHGPQDRALTPEAFRNRIQQKQHELLTLEKQN